MNGPSFQTFVLVTLLSTSNAWTVQPPKSEKANMNRRLASIGRPADPIYEAVKTQGATKRPRNVSLRLALTAGLGTSSGSEVAATSNLSDGSDKGISFAFAADLTLYRYFGFELEASSGLKSTQSNSVDAETPFSEQRSRTISSAMTNLKGQVPFKLGSVRFIPKAGLGYGVASVSEEYSLAGFEDASTSQTSIRLNVPYFVAGLEARPAYRWIFAVDFAKSVQGSGRMVFGNSSSDRSINELSLTRLRASLAYRIGPNVSLGGEFVNRSIGFSQTISDGSSFPASIQQNQFMGLVQFEL